jgi:hypothetical protein
MEPARSTVRDILVSSAIGLRVDHFMYFADADTTTTSIDCPRPMSVQNGLMTYTEAANLRMISTYVSISPSSQYVCADKVFIEIDQGRKKKTGAPF